MEASGQSGKVAKEDEVKAILITFSTRQDLSQAGGTPCPGLHSKKVKSVWELKEKDKGEAAIDSF